jgi:hypothetical protein
VGEIAEMVIDGCMCQDCMCFIGDGVGYPRRCASCESEYNRAQKAMRKAANKAKPVRRKVACQICGKRVWESGIPNHVKDAHGIMAEG